LLRPAKFIAQAMSEEWRWRELNPRLVNIYNIIYKLGPFGIFRSRLKNRQNNQLLVPLISARDGGTNRQTPIPKILHPFQFIGSQLDGWAVALSDGHCELRRESVSQRAFSSAQ